MLLSSHVYVSYALISFLLIVMVIDTGGGTFDVTIAEFVASTYDDRNCQLHVRTSAGNAFLGGRDLDCE